MTIEKSKSAVDEWCSCRKRVAKPTASSSLVWSTPPAWLMNQYIELARPGRAIANLVQRQPLPGGTDSINLPKVLSGTAVGVQTADNQPVTDVDLTDTFINAPVRTISGQQGVAIQLIDQSPIAFDDVIFRDLVAAHAATTDQQVLDGSGSAGQVLGINYTPNISTIVAASGGYQDTYKAIANAIQLVHTTRFLPAHRVDQFSQPFCSLLLPSRFEPRLARRAAHHLAERCAICGPVLGVEGQRQALRDRLGPRGRRVQILRHSSSNGRTQTGAAEPGYGFEDGIQPKLEPTGGECRGLVCQPGLNI